MRVTVIPFAVGTLRTVSKGLEKGLEGLELGGRIETSIIKIGQNTEKSPGYLRRLAVTQIPMEDH